MGFDRFANDWLAVSVRISNGRAASVYEIPSVHPLTPSHSLHVKHGARSAIGVGPRIWFWFPTLPCPWGRNLVISLWEVRNPSERDYGFCGSGGLGGGRPSAPELAGLLGRQSRGGVPRPGRRPLPPLLQPRMGDRNRRQHHRQGPRRRRPQAPPANRHVPLGYPFSPSAFLLGFLFFS